MRFRFFQDGAVADESTILGVNQMTADRSKLLLYGSISFIYEHFWDTLFAYAFVFLFL